MSEPPLPPPESAGWTDEEWIAWLDATDEGSADPEDAAEPVSPSGAMGRLAHSGGGQVLGAAMLGMARAIFGDEPEEVQAVAEAPGQPEEDEPGLHLDAEDPSRSRYVLPLRREEVAEPPVRHDGSDEAAPSDDAGAGPQGGRSLPGSAADPVERPARAPGAG